MKVAAEAGINIRDFWYMTPYELNIYTEGYVERLIKNKKNDIEQAYAISRWVWAKRVDIQSIIDKIGVKQKQVMTDEAIFNQIKQLNEALGGETIG